MKDILKAIVYGGLFAVPLLTLYVENDYFFPFITGKNFAFRIIVEIVLAAWVLLALYDTRYRPKFSWLLSAFSALIVIMAASSALAIHPATSFFSNFERMDGFVTLAHVFLYVLVLGSMLTEKRHWQYYLYTTLAVAFFVALHGLSQYAAGTEGGYRGRIEGQLGNAAYMAIYMLFHIFFAFWMFVESKSTGARVAFAGLAALFLFTLVETGTRGTTLGFIAGATVMIAYIGLCGARFKQFRTYALVALACLVLVVGGLAAARDSAWVKENPNLDRIASLTSPTTILEQLDIRFTIWGMALRGVAERPLLGWGQGNFNYVFNEYYEPNLFGQEQWFDRVHNIVLDWLIAGGVLGFVAYVSLFVSVLYYLVWRPWRYDDQTFNVLERAVLLGIVAGYVTHNLVVFDNIVSYIFFAVILALLHSRVAERLPSVDTVRIDQKLITQFAAPVAAVVVAALIYTLHVPNMQAAADIIDSYREQSPAAKLEAFRRALSRDSFAQQEIVEQLAQQAMNIVRDQNIPEAQRQEFLTLAERSLLELVAAKPNDARIHVFLGTFYRSTGQPEKAAEQMRIARELSPRKQAIIAQQGVIALSLGDQMAARDFFKEAFTLDERNFEAREYYASILFLTGAAEEAKSLAVDAAAKERFAMNDFLVNSVSGAGELAYLAELYEIRVQQQPDNAQPWASLAFVHYKNNNTEAALETLAEAAIAVPSFASTSRCVAANIKLGKPAPEEGCF
jgi:O-antigen ligase/cytochrome c-type biogenesis protein CcmH/NrfG